MNMRLRLSALVLACWGTAAVAMDLASEEMLPWEANAAVPAECDEKPAAKVQIGGIFNVGTFGRWTEGVNADGKRRTVRSTAFETDTANLIFKITATENSWLTVRFDLDDAWNNNYDHDDFLEELYFTFNNIACTGLGVKFGKMEIPFGFDKDVLMVHPYLHALGETNFTKRINGNNQWSGNTASPFHAGTFGGNGYNYSEFHSVEYDNTFAITPYWDICDGKLLFEASLFQSKRDVNDDRRRSNDDLLFHSGAFRVTWRPIEKLMLQASVIARHNDSSRGGRLEKNMYATSLAAEYTFDLFCREMNVFAEWQHAWNPYRDSQTREWGSDIFSMDDSSSDDIHFGIGYQLFDRIKIHAQGEWLRMRNDKRNTGSLHDNDSTLWRAVFATETKLPGGIIMESGYQYEWLKLDHYRANTGVRKDSYTASTWYSGLKFVF